jgi:hypothetical protein
MAKVTLKGSLGVTETTHMALGGGLASPKGQTHFIKKKLKFFLSLGSGRFTPKSNLFY